MKHKKKLKTLLALSPVALSAVGVYAFISAGTNAADTQNTQKYNLSYDLKSITYSNNLINLSSEINFVSQSDVASSLVQKAKNVLSNKGVSVADSKRVSSDKTNLLIGIKSDNDSLIKSELQKAQITVEEDFFTKDDAYLIAIKNNTIYAYAKDNRALSYALNVLEEISKETSSKLVYELEIKDYASLSNRVIFDNTIWSQEKRKDFITWSAKNRINNYIYYAKDDSFTRQEWQEKYSDSALSKIQELATVSKENFINFVYTINPLQINGIVNNDFYDANFSSLKEKLEQLISVGVHHFALSSIESQTDADLQTKLLGDLKTWLETKKAENPEISDTIFYFVNEKAPTTIPQYFNDLASKVKVVAISGKEFGAISNEFVNNFNTATSQKANILVNWPNTSENFDTLVLRGFDSILVSDLDVSKVESLVFAPSNNEEVSKLNLSVGANYSWNVWTSTTQKDQLLKSAFRKLFSATNTASEESEALDLISFHITNYGMTEAKSTTLNESENIKDSLNALLPKIQNRSYTNEEINSLKDTFSALKDASNSLLSSTKNTNLINELRPWLSAFKDLSESLAEIMDSLIYLKADSFSTFNTKFANAEQLFKNSQSNHSFKVSEQSLSYNPQVGIQQLVPFTRKIITSLKNRWVENVVFTIQDVKQKFFSSRGDTAHDPSLAAPHEVLNKNNTNEVIYKNPNRVDANEFFGVSLSKPITLNKIYIKQGGGNDHFFHSQLEYKLDGEDEWISLGTYTRNSGATDPITYTGLNIKNVVAVRLKATQSNGRDAWIRVSSFALNDYVPPVSEKQWYRDLQYSAADSTNTITNKSNTTPDRVLDDATNTEWWLTSDSRDNFQANSYIGFKLPARRAITRFYIEQGHSNSGDVLDNFKVEYFDYTANAWKQFGSKNLNRSQHQLLSGYAMTDKIRIYNNSNRPIWWRLATVKVGGPQLNNDPQYEATSTNIMIANNSSVNDASKNNKFEYVVDKNDTTMGTFTHSPSGTITTNDHLDILFDDYKAIKSFRILQDGHNGDFLRKFKLQKIVNDTYTDIFPEVVVGDELEKLIEIPKTTGKMNGIRLIALEDTQKWWRLRGIDVNEAAQETREYLIAPSGGGETLVTKFENNTFSLYNRDNPDQNHDYTLNANSEIGFDFKTLYKLKRISADYQTQAHFKVFSSENGYIWHEISDLNNLSDVAAAQYLVIRNTSDAQQTISLKNLIVDVDENTGFGSLDSKTTLETENKENLITKPEFDGDFETSNVYSAPIEASKRIVYNLGEAVDLNSLRIYTKDQSSDYPRAITVSVSTNKETWNDVFEINDQGALNDTKVLSDTIYGFFDEKHENFRYWGADDLNLQGIKYIRLSVKSNYPSAKRLEINEIVINGGYRGKENTDLRFSGENLESNNKLSRPENIADNDYSTVFAPSSASGTLVYKVTDADFRNKDLRIISKENPENTTLKITVYNTTTNQAEEIVLGKLSLNTIDFKLPITEDTKKLLNISLVWENKAPVIAEVAKIDKPQNASEVNKTEFNNLLDTEPANYANWTQESKDEFAKLKEKLSPIKTSEYVRQESVNDAKTLLDVFIQNAKLKGNTETLEQKLANKIVNNDQGIYTKDSFDNYKKQIEEIEKKLQDKDNLSQVQINQLERQLEAATNSLVISQEQKAQANANKNKFDSLNTQDWTQESYAPLQASAEKLKTALEEQTTTEDKFKELNTEFSNLFSQLKATEKGQKVKEYNAYKDTVIYDLIDNQENSWPKHISDIATELEKQDKVVENADATEQEVEAALATLKEQVAKLEAYKQSKIKELEEASKSELNNIAAYLDDNSYNNYKKAVAEAKSALENPSVLSESKINSLIEQIKLTKEQLKFNRLKIVDQINRRVANKTEKDALLNKLETLLSLEDFDKFIKEFEDKYKDVIAPVEPETPAEKPETKPAEVDNKDTNSLADSRYKNKGSQGGIIASAILFTLTALSLVGFALLKFFKKKK
ncbi:beta-N-acetylglucosaminidase domain-containing protein [Mycoplasma procyoni]|uniref:beta-N-acetylglucosaminidase domain-containing protein n=1 Tax=Mycoplasma procyoni TaxID=568784 RepID=UPI00197BAF9E|nr:beta-N-acetylglucosaminidase domain-containing protein [Mycoplasma procyoni]MBN3534912.1 beta-N-acetylglucosaminidase domain-containing protein [Mycoplasma procyoni]